MASSNYHPYQEDYWGENVEVETSNGQRIHQNTFLLRVYPETFNDLDAYMDIPFIEEKPDFKKIHSSKLDITWEVVSGPSESPINGNFRGDDTPNNPRAWIFGLRKISP